jgi:hypothetical protein
MRRPIVFSLGLCLVLAGPALAQDAPKKDEGEKKSDAKPDEKKPDAKPEEKKDDDAKKTLVLDTPADWKPEPPQGGMMPPKAFYKLPAAEGDSEPAEVKIYFFNGLGGGVDDNMNRWCGFFKLADGSPFPKEDAKIEKAKKNGIEVTTVEIAGTYTPASFMGPKQDPKPGFILIAAVIEGPDGPWFTRIVGPKKTIEKHRAEYAKWLESAHAGVEGEKKEVPKKPEGDKK